MNFTPEQPKIAQNVPYFDDVTAKDGWAGHATSKSIDTLKAEIVVVISRLGGMVSENSFQRGSFLIDDKKREGFQIQYAIQHPDGSIVPARLDVAALPVRNDYRLNRTLKKRSEQSLKMALYMLRSALEGTWFLQQLSPGYAPLMPWMLEKSSGKTISQLWAESTFGKLLPPGNSEFVEGEYREVQTAR